jgi:hypothetical protein
MLTIYYVFRAIGSIDCRGTRREGAAIRRG